MIFDLDSILNEIKLTLFNTDISLTRVVVVLGFSLIFGIYIFLVYKTAVKNEFYSKDFNRSLIMMSVITAAIVLAIQSNLVISLGMVGALSIVRFRTAIKSSIDLVFIYWSISIGVVCGASLFAIAALLSIIVTVSIIVSNFVETPIKLKLLVIHVRNGVESKEIMAILKEKTKYIRLKNKIVYKDYSEIVLEFKSKNDEFEKDLASIEEIESYSIINYDRETRI